MSCPHLVKINDRRYRCGLIENEADPLKKEAAKILIHSGEGCSHIYGPHPRFLLDLIVNKGLRPFTEEWEQMKENTITEFGQFMDQSDHPE